MKKTTAKNPVALKGGLEANQTRTDIATARQPESSFIVRTERRPTLDSRERWLTEAIERNLPIESAVRGTGLPVRYVMMRYGISPELHTEQFATLQKLKEKNGR